MKTLFAAVVAASLAGCAPPPVECDHSKLEAELALTRESLSDAIKQLAHANAEARALSLENDQLKASLQAAHKVAIPPAPPLKPPKLDLVDAPARGQLIIQNNGGPLTSGVVAVRYDWRPNNTAGNQVFPKVQRMTVQNIPSGEYERIYFEPPAGEIRNLRIILERSN